MLEDHHRGPRQSKTEDEGRVILFIAEHQTSFRDQAGQVEGVCGKAHAESNGVFRAQEPRDGFFQLVVYGQSAQFLVRAGGAQSVDGHALDGGFGAVAFVLCEPQIIITGQIDEILPVGLVHPQRPKVILRRSPDEANFGPRHRRHWPEKGVFDPSVEIPGVKAFEWAE